MDKNNFKTNENDKQQEGFSYIQPDQGGQDTTPQAAVPLQSPEPQASVLPTQLVQPACPAQKASQQLKSDPAVDLLTGKTWPKASANQQEGTPNCHVTAAAQADYSDVTKKKEKKLMNPSLRTFLIAFAGALLACILFWLVSSCAGKSVSVQIGGSGAEITATDNDATLAEQVAQKCLPSTVAIDVYVEASKVPSSSTSAQHDGNYLKYSQGSGIVLSSDGYILTNNHVIASGDKFKVTIFGDTYDANKVGADSSTDVAVLKVSNGKSFKAIELGDSDRIVVGEWVMSLGSPFGLEQSVATGIVSATSRSQVIRSETDGSPSIYTNMIQTDAAINPGNSGGPLVNEKGQVIGINTMIQSSSGNYSGVGFAIPANFASNIAKQIIEGKTPTHAYLGASFTNVTSRSAQQYGFAVSYGAYVSSVVSGSPAEKAGLQKGDILVEFDGQKASSSSDVLINVRKKNPGDKVTLKVNRNSQEMALDVTLGSVENAQTNTQSNSNSNSKSQDLEDYLRKYFGN
ncbi:MAG: trypsin-like peptidase domain-containing protein [Eggerthellaceae bacterium]|nr:trypsin-like peptidase domain-containing protein [Eggerthellaceae bacterium]